MNRSEIVTEIKNRRREFDILVIGGGATGLGIALDAALRGLDVVLFEKGDFASQTSSMSTKLVHGGVRYLKSLDLRNLLESSTEQNVIRNQAPHLVNEIDFLLPTKNWFQKLYYSAGFLLFDLLSSWTKKKFNLQNKFSKFKSFAQVKQDFPEIKEPEVSGGILYHDCLFDDSRFAFSLFEKASENAALILNYCEVTKFNYIDGKISSVMVHDTISDETIKINSKIFVNATGSESDKVIRFDNPKLKPIIDRVQGTHVVLPMSFLNGSKGFIVPKTKRQRVFYAIPWFGVLLLGTTETRLKSPEDVSFPQDDEIDYLLEEYSNFFKTTPQRSDILSVFSGIRPLIIQEGNSDPKKFTSRDHEIFESETGLITIAGGKWTTYRKMALDVVNLAMERGGFIKLPSKTRGFKFVDDPNLDDFPPHLRQYGNRAREITELENANPSLKKLIHPELPYRYSQIYWAIHHEHVLHLDDILLRRTRSMYLNVKATCECLQDVAEFVRKETGKNDRWVRQELDRFLEISRKFQVKNFK